MADMVAVMHEGRLQQLAAPAELYARPANLFVARFCGSPPMNVLTGEVTDGVFRAPGGARYRSTAPATAARSSWGSGPSMRPGRSRARRRARRRGLRGRAARQRDAASPSGRRRPINVRAAAGVQPAGRQPLRVLPARRHTSTCSTSSRAPPSHRPDRRSRPNGGKAGQATAGSDHSASGEGSPRRAGPGAAAGPARCCGLRRSAAAAAACSAAARRRAAPITIGSFSDPAMVPFRDMFLKKYTAGDGQQGPVQRDQLRRLVPELQERRPPEDRRLRHLRDGRQLGAGVRRLRDRPEPGQAGPEGEPRHPPEGPRAGLLAAQVGAAAEGFRERQARSCTRW